MKITELKPLEKNPFKSKGDEQIKKIAKSIQAFEKMMPIRPIIYDETNTILGGNKRYFALKMLGYKDIPTEWAKQVTDLSEDEKKEFIVKDNSHWGSEWDFDLLEDWGCDLDDWGIEVKDFEESETDAEIKEVNITAYKKTHILISFEPEKMILIQDYIQKIKDTEGIEYEQSSN